MSAGALKMKSGTIVKQTMHLVVNNPFNSETSTIHRSFLGYFLNFFEKIRFFLEVLVFHHASFSTVETFRSFKKDKQPTNSESFFLIIDS